MTLEDIKKFIGISENPFTFDNERFILIRFSEIEYCEWFTLIVDDEQVQLNYDGEYNTCTLFTSVDKSEVEEILNIALESYNADCDKNYNQAIKEFTHMFGNK